MQTKKAIFTPIEITIIKKKGNIIINVNDIKRIDYTKPSFFNKLLAGLFPDGTFPGYLKVFFNKKIGRYKSYSIKVEYEEFLELPEVYKKLSNRF